MTRRNVSSFSEFKDNHGIEHYNYCNIDIITLLTAYIWKVTSIDSILGVQTVSHYYYVR